MYAVCTNLNGYRTFRPQYHFVHSRFGHSTSSATLYKDASALVLFMLFYVLFITILCIINHIEYKNKYKIEKNDIVQQILSLFLFSQSRRCAGPHEEKKPKSTFYIALSLIKLILLMFQFSRSENHTRKIGTIYFRFTKIETSNFYMQYF